MNTALFNLFILIGCIQYKTSFGQAASAEQDPQRTIEARPKQAYIMSVKPRRWRVFNRHVHNGKVSR